MKYFVSIIIPTLNSQAVIEQCLSSIQMQDYPKEKIEVIICDGGSKDSTLELVKKFDLNIKIFFNRLKTGEAGKALGIKMANGEIVAFIDSDNELPDNEWLKKMTAPFNDPEIFASESFGYTYLKKDTYINRYTALTGNPDPMCIFIGNYSYYCYLNKRWTLLPVKWEDRGDYLKVEILNKEKVPTFGANGFLIRASVLKEIPVGDYYFDIDIVQELVEREKKFLAKVKTSIIHHFCQNYFAFVRKQLRRIRDYQYYQANNLRRYRWNKYFLGYLKFIVSTILFIPLIFQAFKGYFRKKDLAWFFHPVACWTTFLVYGYGVFTGFFVRRQYQRNFWKQ